jgi:lipopolysaccharide/colanic/teichoic acid biosynthesis glycosyltransferase
MLRHRKSGKWYPRVKRLADICGASAALVIASPLMLLTAIAIRLSFGKPILFRQIRPGLNERRFVCLKFRTMTDDRDENGQLLPDELRLTWLGTLLRRTSLDELPQMWNVLCGHVSLIGPRPLLERYLPYYTETEQRRHSVRPGLTGWAQIHQRSRLPFDQRLEMDVWYVDHLSWQLDLRIFLATIWVVITQHGTTPEDESPLLPLDVQRASLLAIAAESNATEVLGYGSQRK